MNVFIHSPEGDCNTTGRLKMQHGKMADQNTNFYRTACDENSVRLSVRLSVKRVNCDKTEES